MPFTVLYVCTGNVCRSPMAELMLRALSTDDITISSAGLRALVGYGIDDGSAAALRNRGIDPTGHRARQFEPAMATAADLILTAEVTHRDAILGQLPTLLRRTFTIPEFARLAGHVEPGAAPSEAVTAAAGLRGVLGPAAPGSDDVPDPFRASAERTEPVAALIEAATRTAAAALQLTTIPTRPRPIR
jgi:protein-tyrosine phosphatase